MKTANVNISFILAGSPPVTTKREEKQASYRFEPHTPLQYPPTKNKEGNKFNFKVEWEMDTGHTPPESKRQSAQNAAVAGQLDPVYGSQLVKGEDEEEDSIPNKPERPGINNISPIMPCSTQSLTESIIGVHREIY